MGTIRKVNVNGQEYELAGAGGGGSIIEITYSELKQLKDASNLVPEQKYRITDYVTQYSSPGSSEMSGGHPFDLIVMASSVNSFYQKCSAALHEGDSYFANCNLSNWEIKYSFESTKFSKGEILYLKDDYNNEAPFDFKNQMVLVKKTENPFLPKDLFFYTFSLFSSLSNLEQSSISDASIGVEGVTVKNNSINYTGCVFATVKPSMSFIYNLIEGNIVTSNKSVVVFNISTMLSGFINNTFYANVEFGYPVSLNKCVFNKFGDQRNLSSYPNLTKSVTFESCKFNTGIELVVDKSYQIRFSEFNDVDFNSSSKTLSFKLSTTGDFYGLKIYIEDIGDSDNDAFSIEELISKHSAVYVRGTEYKIVDYFSSMFQ